MYGVKLFVEIYIVRSVQRNKTASIEYVQKFIIGGEITQNVKFFIIALLYPHADSETFLLLSLVWLSWSTAGEIIISYPLFFFAGKSRCVRVRKLLFLASIPLLLSVEHVMC